jgi:peptide/nickel transport system permease protein
VFKLIIRRLFLGVVTLFAISILVFAGTELLPGDVAQAILGQSATEATVAALREQLGLNMPAYVRYFDWLGGVLTGDLGVALTNGMPLDKIIGQRLENTIYLALYAAVIAVPVSLLLGLLSAAWPDSAFDRGISVSTVFFISIPDFVIAIILVMIFAVELGWLPSMVHRPNWGHPFDTLWQLVLPMVTLVLSMLAHMVRMTRAAVLDVLKSAYIEMAILKGAPKSRIILRHAIPNALGPIVNVIALNLGYLISGVVVVEVIFTYPGLGRLMVDSVVFRDVPQIQIVAMVFCSFYVGLNILADIGAIMTNPRLRYAK